MEPILVKWNGSTFDIPVNSAMTIEEFKYRIWSVTDVRPENQKLLGIAKGADSSLLECKKNKVTLIGTPSSALVREQQAEKKVQVQQGGQAQSGSEAFKKTKLPSAPTPSQVMVQVHAKVLELREQVTAAEATISSSSSPPPSSSTTTTASASASSEPKPSPESSSNAISSAATSLSASLSSLSSLTAQMARGNAQQSLSTVRAHHVNNAAEQTGIVLAGNNRRLAQATTELARTALVKTLRGCDELLTQQLLRLDALQLPTQVPLAARTNLIGSDIPVSREGRRRLVRMIDSVHQRIDVLQRRINAEAAG